MQKKKKIGMGTSNSTVPHILQVWKSGYPHNNSLKSEICYDAILKCTDIH